MLRACCMIFSRVLRVQCTSCCCSALPETDTAQVLCSALCIPAAQIAAGGGVQGDGFCAPALWLLLWDC